MPLDATPLRQTDDLSDIDITKPLSIESIRRIVQATRQAELLAMDHPTAHLLRLTLDPSENIFFSPHQAVDAFLGGTENRGSCPCHFSGVARTFLEKLNNAHRSLLLYRSIAPDTPVRAQLEDQFSLLMYGKLPADCLVQEPFWDFGS